MTARPSITLEFLLLVALVSSGFGGAVVAVLWQLLVGDSIP